MKKIITMIGFLSVYCASALAGGLTYRSPLTQLEKETYISNASSKITQANIFDNEIMKLLRIDYAAGKQILIDNTSGEFLKGQQLFQLENGMKCQIDVSSNELTLANHQIALLVYDGQCKDQNTGNLIKFRPAFLTLVKE